MIRTAGGFIDGNPFTVALESFLYLLVFIMFCMIYSGAVQAIHDGVKKRREWREERANVSSAPTQWPTTTGETNNAENAPELTSLARALTEMNFYDEILRVHTSKDEPHDRDR